MILNTFVEVCKFESVNHFQFTIKLTDLLATESIEIRYFTKAPNDDEWYLEEPSVTLGPGPFPGTGDNNRDNYTIPFIAAKGIKVEAKQTGGTAKTLSWYMWKV